MTGYSTFSSGVLPCEVFSPCLAFTRHRPFAAFKKPIPNTSCTSGVKCQWPCKVYGSIWGQCIFICHIMFMSFHVYILGKAYSYRTVAFNELALSVVSCTNWGLGERFHLYMYGEWHNAMICGSWELTFNPLMIADCLFRLQWYRGCSSCSVTWCHPDGIGSGLFFVVNEIFTLIGEANSYDIPKSSCCLPDWNHW